VLFVSFNQYLSYHLRLQCTGAAFIVSLTNSPSRTPGVLLKTLCDKTNRIGEIGYFLASFEAAITHIQEIDLSEDRESMLSFSSTPLTDDLYGRHGEQLRSTATIASG
jgi:hypothetical protein